MSPGVILGKYWGPSTANGGLPASYLDLNRDSFPEARDDGDYLLQHGTYMVDAAADCPMGYINEGWSAANCFFQPNPDRVNELVVVSWYTFPPNGVYELFTNYGFLYWLHRRHLLDSTTGQECLRYYRTIEDTETDNDDDSSVGW